MSDLQAARDELVHAAAAFDRENARLGQRDVTTDEWFRLVLRRLDALDRLRATAPSDPLLALHDAADRLSMARLKRRVSADHKAAA